MPSHKSESELVVGQYQQQEKQLERLRRRYEQLDEELTKLEARLPQLPAHREAEASEAPGEPQVGTESQPTESGGQGSGRTARVGTESQPTKHARPNKPR